MLPGLLLWFTLLHSGLEQPLVQAVRGCCALSAYGSFWMISSSASCRCSRYSHLEIWTSRPLPSFLSALVRCLGVACGVRRIFGTGALLGSTVDTCSTGGFGRISLILRCGELEFQGVCFPFLLKGEVCTVAASGCSFSQRGSHFDAGHYFQSSAYDSLRQFSLRRAAFLGALPPEGSQNNNNNNTIWGGSV